MVKIAFSGIPASGKTSLLQEVRKIMAIHHTVEFTTDPALANPFDLDQKNTFASHFFHMTTQIHQEHLALLNSPQLLLCDRSVLDQWVYWKKLLQETTWNEQLAKRHEVISHLFHFWLPSYALICHIRCDWKTLQKRLKKDTLRGVHAEQVKKYEELFLQTINEEQVKPVEIWNNLSLDECAQNVIQEISARKLLP